MLWISLLVWNIWYVPDSIHSNCVNLNHSSPISSSGALVTMSS